jgi:hypothetical protein
MRVQQLKTLIIIYHPILIALKYILLGLAHRIGEKEKQRKII